MHTSFFMIATLAIYFLILLYISQRSLRKGGRGNNAFFRAGRQSSWWMVAIGMIGASISGVTFISVPGWAQTTGMTYLQMCMGFIVGYVVVAFVLLPLYYKLRLTSIYAYLGTRFGRDSHRTGAIFFVLSKLTGAAARLYLVCFVISQFVVRPLWGDGTLPFVVTTLCVLCLIWFYTCRSGIQAVVRTDVLQTFVSSLQPLAFFSLRLTACTSTLQAFGPPSQIVRCVTYGNGMHRASKPFGDSF